jgi:hypothetical protein
LRIFKTCHIIYNILRTINVHGFEEDVKTTICRIKDLIIEIKDCMAKNLKNLMSGKVTAENVEWEYGINSVWKPFNLFHNSCIETSYSLKKTEVRKYKEIMIYWSYSKKFRGT